MGSGQKFMTLEDVAKMLGVNYQLIYRLVRSGELPAIRLGRVYRVTQDDLMAYLTRQKTSVAGGTVCDACGTVYKSRESVQQTCEKCGAPICFDCWQRAKVHICKACASEKKKGGARKK